MDSILKLAQVPHMEQWLERRALALRHVENGRRIVDRQRTLIGRCKVLGINTELAESLFLAFERSQIIFEHDLADLDRRKPLEGSIPTAPARLHRPRASL